MPNTASKTFLGPMIHHALRKEPISSYMIITSSAAAIICLAAGAMIGKALAGSGGVVVGMIIGAFLFSGLVTLGAYPSTTARKILMRQWAAIVCDIAFINNRVAFKDGGNTWSWVPFSRDDAKRLSEAAAIPITETSIASGCKIERALKCATSNGAQTRVVHINAILELSPGLDPLEVFVAHGENQVCEAVQAIEKIVVGTQSSCPDPDSSANELSLYQADLEGILEAHGVNDVIVTPATPYIIRRLFVTEITDS